MSPPPAEGAAWLQEEFQSNLPTLLRKRPCLSLRRWSSANNMTSKLWPSDFKNSAAFTDQAVTLAK